MARQEVLEQVCCNCNEGYCSAKQLLIHYVSRVVPLLPFRGENDRECLTCPYKRMLINCHLTDDVAVQFKCIEIFKLNRSRELRREVSFIDALKEWISFGYAQRYRDLYSEATSLGQVNVRDIYNQIVEERKLVAA